MGKPPALPATYLDDLFPAGAPPATDPAPAETAPAPGESTHRRRRDPGSLPAARTPFSDDRSEAARLTVLLPHHVLEQLRCVAYWDRETLPQVLTAALEREFAARETARGGSYPPQAGPIKRGRPLKV